MNCAFFMHQDSRKVRCSRRSVLHKSYMNLIVDFTFLRQSISEEEEVYESFVELG